MDEMPQEQQDLAEPKDKLILIVDDDESILDLMQHVLSKEGFRIDRAADGQEALRKADALSPDMIILDFMLPGIGGFEVLKELQMAGASIPILVITGRHMERQNIGMIKQESNVREFMEKPLRPALLASTVHRILQTRPPDVRRSVDRGPMSGSW